MAHALFRKSALAFGSTWLHGCMISVSLIISIFEHVFCIHSVILFANINY